MFRFPIKSRLLLSLATFALIVLVGLVILSELAFAPDADTPSHSRIYISQCPDAVYEEGPSEPEIATVTTTADEDGLFYYLDMVNGTADHSDFGYRSGGVVTSNPHHLKTVIIDDDHLDDGETFIVTVGSRQNNVGRNADQRCTVTIRDNDPPRVRHMRLVSEPADGDTYRRGEKIEIEVAFDNKVRVVGNPAVRLWLTTPWGRPVWSYPSDPSDIKKATYASGNETKVLTFAYEVRAGDRDGDGLVVPSLNHTSLGKGTIKWAFGDRDADHFTDDKYHAHKVDGRESAGGTN